MISIDIRKPVDLRVQTGKHGTVNDLCDWESCHPEYHDVRRWWRGFILLCEFLEIQAIAADAGARLGKNNRIVRVGADILWRVGIFAGAVEPVQIV